MRKIRIIEQISWDGVIQAPGGRGEGGDDYERAWRMERASKVTASSFPRRPITPHHWRGLVRLDSNSYPYGTVK